MKTVVIIGGGFCGTLAAINLARLSTRPLRVILVNSRHPLGRGIAYGTRRREHLLNVVARNMSAFPGPPVPLRGLAPHPRRLRGSSAGGAARTVCARGVFMATISRISCSGRLQPLGGPGRVHCDLIDDEVIDVAPAGRGATVVSEGRRSAGGGPGAARHGEPHAARRDSTRPSATSTPPTAATRGRRGTSSFRTRSEDVLLVGTGLTMIDVFLTLRARLGRTIHADLAERPAAAAALQGERLSALPAGRASGHSACTSSAARWKSTAPGCGRTG